MKKVILILCICLSCYFVYNFTDNNELDYLNIGDGIAMGITSNNAKSSGYSIRLKNYLEENKKLDDYNDSFTNKDYRITDVLKSIKYHDKITINDDEKTINELLKDADIITISLGMNELYYKLLLNTDNIYGYIDDMMVDMKELLKEVDRYNHKKVFVLGYYNVLNKNNDIFTYVNYKLKEIVNQQGFEFISLESVVSNKNSFVKNNNFYLDNSAYNKIFQIIVDKIKNY